MDHTVGTLGWRMLELLSLASTVSPHSILVIPPPLLGFKKAQDSGRGPALDTGWSTCARPDIQTVA